MRRVKGRARTIRPPALPGPAASPSPSPPARPPVLPFAAAAPLAFFATTGNANRGAEVNNFANQLLASGDISSAEYGVLLKEHDEGRTNVFDLPSVMATLDQFSSGQIAPEQAGPPRSAMMPEQAGPPRSLMNPETKAAPAKETKSSKVNRQDRKARRLEQRFAREGVSTLSDMAGGKDYTPIEDNEKTPAIFSAEAPKAEAPKDEAPDPAEMQKLFRTVMGSSFDPKSRMDRQKMQDMMNFYTTSGGMGGRTPTRFALDYYKTLK